MIGRISGILLEKQAPELLIDTGGIGYEVLVSLTTFFGLPAEGEIITLLTHLVVREDIQQLYGFADRRERELFRSLIKVSGVGPKMALAILSGMTAEEFVSCIRADNAVALVKLPGVGKKTAERLIIEMRDRIGEWHGVSEETAETTDISHAHATQEAESALISLGYRPQEAARMIGKVADQADESESLIRLALQSVVSKRA